MSGPWLCAHLWEHYLFSRDAEFLKRAYPLMKGSAEFCRDWLIDDGHGHLTTCPRSRPKMISLRRMARRPKPARAARWTWR